MKTDICRRWLPRAVELAPRFVPFALDLIHLDRREPEQEKPRKGTRIAEGVTGGGTILHKYGVIFIELLRLGS